MLAVVIVMVASTMILSMPITEAQKSKTARPESEPSKTDNHNGADQNVQGNS